MSSDYYSNYIRFSWLLKESRWLGSMRNRFVHLDMHHGVLRTFKTIHIESNDPTETFYIGYFTNIKPYSNKKKKIEFGFKIENNVNVNTKNDSSSNSNNNNNNNNNNANDCKTDTDDNKNDTGLRHYMLYHKKSATSSKIVINKEDKEKCLIFCCKSNGEAKQWIELIQDCIIRSKNECEFYDKQQSMWLKNESKQNIAQYIKSLTFNNFNKSYNNFDDNIIPATISHEMIDFYKKLLSFHHNKHSSTYYAYYACSLFYSNTTKLSHFFKCWEIFSDQIISREECLYYFDFICIIFDFLNDNVSRIQLELSSKQSQDRQSSVDTITSESKSNNNEFYNNVGSMDSWNINDCKHNNNSNNNNNNNSNNDNSKSNGHDENCVNINLNKEAKMDVIVSNATLFSDYCKTFEYFINLDDFLHNYSSTIQWQQMVKDYFEINVKHCIKITQKIEIIFGILNNFLQLAKQFFSKEWNNTLLGLCEYLCQYLMTEIDIPQMISLPVKNSIILKVIDFVFIDYKFFDVDNMTIFANRCNTDSSTTIDSILNELVIDELLKQKQAHLKIMPIFESVASRRNKMKQNINHKENDFCNYFYVYCERLIVKMDDLVNRHSVGKEFAYLRECLEQVLKYLNKNSMWMKVSCNCDRIEMKDNGDDNNSKNGNNSKNERCLNQEMYFWMKLNQFLHFEKNDNDGNNFIGDNVLYDMPILFDYEEEISLNWENFYQIINDFSKWNFENSLHYCKFLIQTRKNNQRLIILIESLVEQQPQNKNVLKLQSRFDELQNCLKKLSQIGDFLENEEDDDSNPQARRQRLQSNHIGIENYFDIPSNANGSQRNVKSNNNNNNNNNNEDLDKHAVQVQERKVDETIYDNEDVKQFLVNMLHLEQYYEIFIDNGIDRNDTIVLLTNSVLKEIGIDKIGHRLAIINALPTVKEKIALQSEGH